MVIEANNVGDCLPALLEPVGATVNWRIVHATRGKRARAAASTQPHKQARIHHVGPPRLFVEPRADNHFRWSGRGGILAQTCSTRRCALWDLFWLPQRATTRG